MSDEENPPSALQNGLTKIGQSQTARIIGHASQLAPGLGILGSVLSDLRSSLWQKEMEQRVQFLENLACTEDEAGDLILRSFVAAQRAATEEKVKKLAAAAVTLCRADNIAYTDAVQFLNYLEELSDYDLQVLSVFTRFDEHRESVGTVLQKLGHDTPPGVDPDVEKLSFVLAAIGKLQSRGLLVQDGLFAMGKERHAGDANHWTGQVVNEGYSLTPLGERLLQTFNEGLRG